MRPIILIVMLLVVLGSCTTVQEAPVTDTPGEGISTAETRTTSTATQGEERQIEPGSDLEVFFNRGYLVVGTTDDAPPLRLIDEGGFLVGFEIDLVKEIVIGMDLSSELKVEEPDKLVAGVLSGKYDLIVGEIEISPANSQQMIFTKTYFDNGQVIVVPTDSSEVTKPDMLRGRTVGIMEGSDSEAVLGAYSLETIAYKDLNHILDDLSAGTIKAIVTDRVTALELVRQREGIKILDQALSEKPYGIAASPSNSELLVEIDKTLKKMKDSGRVKYLQDKWFG